MEELFLHANAVLHGWLTETTLRWFVQYVYFTIIYEIRREKLLKNFKTIFPQASCGIFLMESFILGACIRSTQ